MKKQLRKGALWAFSLLISAVSFAQQLSGDYQPGKIIFQLKTNTSYRLVANESGEVDFRKVDFLQNAISKYGVVKLTQKHPRNKSAALRNTYELDFSTQANADAFVRELSNLQMMQYAEKKVLHHLYYTPNDPDYTAQKMWHLFKINASAAWDIHKGDSSVIVAVTDVAFKMNHPDLVNVYTTGYDVGQNDADPSPGTGFGLFTSWEHGTHVAGIVGAQSDNNVGIASIGNGIKVMPVKISDNNGNLTSGYEGVVWAADHGARVINMSWGGNQNSAYGQQVISDAYNQGIVLVAAAGNNNAETKSYPSAFPEVICVASSDQSDKKSSFSQYGDWVDITAPGTAIYSTYFQGTNNTYSNQDGTSMASPLVAGLCGLMLSANPTASPDDIVNCLTSTAININALNPTYVGKLGSGRIDAAAALNCIISVTPTLNDVAFSKVLGLKAKSCDTTINASVVFRNKGADTLKTARIYYKIDAANWDSLDWTGVLAMGKADTLVLPTLSSTVGTHNLVIKVGLPNGVLDENILNDNGTQSFSIVSTGGLPYAENFESGLPADISILNPDNNYTWEINSSAKKTGSSSCVSINGFRYGATKEEDDLVLPPLDLTGVNHLRFDLANRMYNNTGAGDTLMVMLSFDCGITYSTVYQKSGVALTTVTPSYSTADFVPTQDAQWRTEVIDLIPYQSQTQALIKFRHINNYQNNTYLDNINVSTEPYTVGIKEENKGVHFTIYPNPTNGIVNVQLSEMENGVVTLSVLDVMGREVLQAKQTGSQSKLIQLHTNELAAGNYTIRVVGEQGTSAKRLVVQ